MNSSGDVFERCSSHFWRTYGSGFDTDRPGWPWTLLRTDHLELLAARGGPFDGELEQLESIRTNASVAVLMSGAALSKCLEQEEPPSVARLHDVMYLHVCALCTFPFPNMSTADRAAQLEVFTKESLRSIEALVDGVWSYDRQECGRWATLHGVLVRMEVVFRGDRPGAISLARRVMEAQESVIARRLVMNECALALEMDLAELGGPPRVPPLEELEQRLDRGLARAREASGASDRRRALAHYLDALEHVNLGQLPDDPLQVLLATLHLAQGGRAGGSEREVRILALAAQASLHAGGLLSDLRVAGEVDDVEEALARQARLGRQALVLGVDKLNERYGVAATLLEMVGGNGGRMPSQPELLSEFRRRREDASGGAAPARVARAEGSAAALDAFRLRHCEIDELIRQERAEFNRKWRRFNESDYSVVREMIEPTPLASVNGQPPLWRCEGCDEFFEVASCRACGEAKPAISGRPHSHSVQCMHCGAGGPIWHCPRCQRENAFARTRWLFQVKRDLSCVVLLVVLLLALGGCLLL